MGSDTLIYTIGRLEALLVESLNIMEEIEFNGEWGCPCCFYTNDKDPRGYYHDPKCKLRITMNKIEKEIGGINY